MLRLHVRYHPEQDGNLLFALGDQLWNAAGSTILLDVDVAEQPRDIRVRFLPMSLYDTDFVLHESVFVIEVTADTTQWRLENHQGMLDRLCSLVRHMVPSQFGVRVEFELDGTCLGKDLPGQENG